MNTTKKLICILTAGAALGAAAPVFADSRHDRNYDQYRQGFQQRDYDRRVNRDFDRRTNRDFAHHHRVMAPRPDVVYRPYVVERPHIIEQPVYYGEPAPMGYIGIGAIIGAVIGGIIDSRH